MSLGRSRGAAVLGRTMDVTALVGMESQEPTPEAGCFSAEVFYGETRISPQNVTITPVRTNPGELALRVRSSTLIDEPFVTLYLRITCSQNLSRKYVLLADSPSEPASPVQSALPLTSSQSLASADTPAASRTGTGGRNGVGSAADTLGARTQADKNAALEAKQARAAARAEKKAALAAESTSPNQAAAQIVPSKTVLARKPAEAATAASRLKIDLLDLTSVREPSLRASTELLTLPSNDPQARTVAAALWRAINKSPDDLVRDGVRLQTIEAEVRAMADTTKQQTQELAS